MLHLSVGRKEPQTMASKVVASTPRRHNALLRHVVNGRTAINSLYCRPHRYGMQVTGTVVR